MASQYETTLESQNPSTSEANLWQQRYRIAYTNQLPLFKRFASWYDGMYTIVNTKTYTLWRSKLYIPILASKVWNLIAKFISMKPGFEVRVRDDGISEMNVAPDANLSDKAYKAQLKLEYDYDNPVLNRPIREKLLASLIDCVVTGTGIAKVPWVVNKQTRYQHPVSKSGEIDMSQEEVIEEIKGYNDLVPVNIFNVFVAPAATDLYTAPWIIIKEYKTLQQLTDVNSAKGIEIYHNLDQLENARATGDQLAVYKKSRNRLTVQYDPIIADKTIDFIEIYECYSNDTDEIVTYANAGRSGGNSWVEIRRQNNPYWHGKYPLVRFTVKMRPFDFWGEGIWETNERLQVAINDIFNHYLDNWSLSVDGMLMAQESAGINDYIVEPGGLITYRTEAPTQFKFPEPNPAGLNAVMEQIMGAIEQNTISNYATGSPDSETDKTRGTKGGILALQQAADDIVAFMRMNFQESVKQIGQMWLSNNQQFMSSAQTVVVNDRNEFKPVKIDPADLQGDMELRVDEASMLPISDDQVKAQYGAFVQQLLQLQQASIQQSHAVDGRPPVTLNFDEIISTMAEKFGFRNIRAILGEAPKGPAPQHQMQAMELAIKAAQAQPKPEAQQAPQPTIQDKMIETLNYKDVPDDIKRQMEQQAGFQPSQTAVNSMQPHIQQANKSVLNMAQQLHAQGALHPSVVDMIRGHMGHTVQQPQQPAAPIGTPPQPVTPTAGSGLPQ